MNQRTVYISHLFEDEKIKKLVENYSCGIELIDFSIGMCLDQVDDTMVRYRQRMGQSIANCPISFHGPFLDLVPYSYDTLIHEATRIRYQQCYDAARKFGAKHIIYHTCYGSNQYYPSIWRERTVQFFRKFMEDKGEEIAIHLENVYDRDYSYLLEVIQEVNHKAFSACLDIGHVNCHSDRSLEKWIDGLGENIGHVHLHNNDGTRDAHQSLNRGSIQIPEIIAQLQKTCPNADWTIEVNTYEDAITSFDMLNKYSGFFF